MGRTQLSRTELAPVSGGVEASAAGARLPASAAWAATANTSAPSAIASCGIHSGVASLLVDTSGKAQDCHPSRPQ